MTISINILSLGDLAKIIADKFGSDKKATKEWLEAVSHQAELLAKAWTSIYLTLSNSSETPPMTAQQLRSLTLAQNAPPFHRLFNFYSSLSTALDHKYKQREQFIQALGSLLHSRNITKTKFEKAFSEISNTEADITLEDLKQAIEAIQKDAATIHVLAKNFH